MSRRLAFILVPVLSLALSVLAMAEEPRQVRTFAVLPTTDITEWQLAEPLQTALGQLAQDSGLFSVELGTRPLDGFTSSEIADSFQAINSELLSFVYLETSRVSIFLFDSKQPGQYIVASEAIGEPEIGQPLNAYLEARFRETWNTVLNSYSNGEYQPLPGGEKSDQQIAQANDEESYRALQARLLFREMASLDEHKYYAGAHFGMARFAAMGSTNSTVNFGATLGVRALPRVNVELGNDVFSYWLLNLTGNYHIPLAEKYVALRASFGVARVMASVTENRGFASSNLPTGEFLAGPGITFEIPLLGAYLRGDIKYYVGSASILVGSYGILYAL